MPGKHTIRKKKQLSWEAVGHSLRSRTAQCVYVILAGAVILCILGSWRGHHAPAV